MQKIVSSGDIVYVMLAFVLIEIATLLGYWYKTGHGVPPKPLLLNIGAGGSLMLAVGASLKGFDWRVTATLLVLAGVFHIFDIRQRWT